MNRRNFLKACGLSAAVIAAPNLVFANTELAEIPADKIKVGNYSDFNPSHEYGNGVIGTGTDKEAAKKMIGVLEKDMITVIPPRYRKYVEYLVRKNLDYGHTMSIAWKYSPTPKDKLIRMA